MTKLYECDMCGEQTKNQLNTLKIQYNEEECEPITYYDIDICKKCKDLIMNYIGLSKKP